MIRMRKKEAPANQESVDELIRLSIEAEFIAKRMTDLGKQIKTELKEPPHDRK